MNITTIKLWLKEKWHIILSALVVVCLVAWAVFRKKPVNTAIDTATVDLQRKLGEVRTQAALEIGRAQGKEEAVKQQVQQINDMPTNTEEDKRKRLQALADLVNNTRRKRD